MVIPRVTFYPYCMSAHLQLRTCFFTCTVYLICIVTVKKS